MQKLWARLQTVSGHFVLDVLEIENIEVSYRDGNVCDFTVHMRSGKSITVADADLDKTNRWVEEVTRNR